jgi:hypothetical protein
MHSERGGNRSRYIIIKAKASGFMGSIFSSDLLGGGLAWNGHAVLQLIAMEVVFTAPKRGLCQWIVV